MIYPSLSRGGPGWGWVSVKILGKIAGQVIEKIPEAV
jgi:hypothetical protein